MALLRLLGKVSLDTFTHVSHTHMWVATHVLFFVPPPPHPIFLWFLFFSFFFLSKRFFFFLSFSPWCWYGPNKKNFIDVTYRLFFSVLRQRWKLSTWYLLRTVWTGFFFFLSFVLSFLSMIGLATWSMLKKPRPNLTYLNLYLLNELGRDDPRAINGAALPMTAGPSGFLSDLVWLTS